MKALHFRNLKLPQVSLVSSETRQWPHFGIPDQLGSARGQPLVCRLPQVVREEGAGRWRELAPSPGWGDPQGEQVYGFVFLHCVCLALPDPSVGTQGLQSSLQHVGAGSPTQAPALWAQSQPLDHPGIPSRFIVILGGLGPGGRTGDKGKVRSREQGFSASAPASSRAGPFFVGGCPLQHRMLSVSGHLLPTSLNARSTPHRTWGCASQKCLWTLLNFCSHVGRSKITPVENHRLRTLLRGQGFETWVVKIPKERFPAHVAGL